MLPATSTRVSEHTSPHSNERSIARSTKRGHLLERWSCFDHHRLAELENEWDMERTLQTNFAVVTMIGIALTALVDRRCSFFRRGSRFHGSALVTGMVPPVPIFRRQGFRTTNEIDADGMR